MVQQLLLQVDWIGWVDGGVERGWYRGHGEERDVSRRTCVLERQQLQRLTLTERVLVMRGDAGAGLGGGCLRFLVQSAVALLPMSLFDELELQRWARRLSFDCVGFDVMRKHCQC